MKPEKQNASHWKTASEPCFCNVCLDARDVEIQKAINAARIEGARGMYNTLHEGITPDNQLSFYQRGQEYLLTLQSK
jgi:hypothetical protein